MRLIAILLSIGTVALACAQVRQDEAPGSPELLAATPADAGNPGGTAEVLLDVDLLAQLERGAPFRIALPSGLCEAYVARVERRSPSSFSVFARVAADPDARLILTSVNGSVAGVFRLPQSQTYLTLRTRAAGGVTLEPFNPAGPDGCGTQTSGRRFPSPVPDGTDGGAAGGERGGPIGEACSEQPTVSYDVLVVYTLAARDEAGGTDQILAEAQLAVDTTNQVYEDSLLALRARLVYVYGTSYVELSDLEDDRDNLADPDDFNMDVVHAYRDLYGADFVVLMVANVGQDGCGIAFCTPSGSAEGFCVVLRECASANFTFPHEVGHLQGCAHNREDAGTGCNEDCYSFGYRFTGDDDQGYRTVMAYNNGAEEFTRIGVLSNPNVFWQGAACGEFGGDCDDDEFNAHTIFNTAYNRENWRNPKFNVWVDFDYAGTERGSYANPWNTLAEGANAVFDLAAPEYSPPQLWLQAGTTSETLTLSKRMTIRACGTAVIGQP